MNNLSTEEWLKKYPHFMGMAHYTLFLSQEEVENLINSKTITIHDKPISIEFLKKVLQDYRFFQYAYKFFSNQTDRFDVSYIISGDTKGLSYSKSQIIKGITELITCGDWYLNSQEQENFNRLKIYVSLDSYEKGIGNKNYEISIDDKTFFIPIKNIIAFMKFSINDFIKICKNNDVEYLYGFPKKYFIYAAYNYFRYNDLVNELNLPKETETLYYNIKSNKFIDIEAINKFIDPSIRNDKFTLDGELKAKILEGMPMDATQLEKAIYIYIKMCKLLTYDEEYFAVNQSYKAVSKHIKESHISNINLENNNIVCFEFNLIYAKLLNELGINYRLVYPGHLGYGFTHASLNFRCDKFLVSADSVTSILQGDLTQAKLNGSLNGLKCTNQNKDTVLEFKASLIKMYNLIADQEKKDKAEKQNIVGHDLTFENLLYEYSKATTNKKELSLDEKFEIMFQKINKTKLITIDAYGYILNVKKILFNQIEKDNNINITIIRNNKPLDSNMVADTIGVLTFNLVSYRQNPEESICYLYKPNQSLQRISLEEIQEMFNSNEVEYINADSPKIPGINLKR